MIGLVPQELTTDAFETVWATVTLQPRPVRQGAGTRPISRRCCATCRCGTSKDSQDHDALRRHEAPGDDRQGAVARAATSCSSTSPPPASTSSCGATCGRWSARLRDSGVTIILTTHYIEEAEEMADRIGVISKGELILVEDKAALMQKLGKQAADPAPAARRSTACRRASATTRWRWPTTARDLIYTFDAAGRGHAASPSCCASSRDAGIDFKDLQTEQSSLEDIFVSLVRRRPMNLHAVRAIYRLRDGAHASARCSRASLAPVISTSLYFVVFGAAIGSRMSQVDGVSYGAFIVPGPDHAVAADREHRQRLASASTCPSGPGTIYELLSAPVSPFEIVLGYVGRGGDRSR